MKSLYFQVAERYYCVQFTDDNADFRTLLNTSAPFNVRRPSAEVPMMFTLTVGEGLVDAKEEGERIGEFDCGGIMHRVFRMSDGGYKMLLTDVTGELACAYRANADFSRCECSVFGGIATQTFGITNANMISFAFAGASHGILLMHSSVPMKDGYGYLCQGKSGTGKSTHSSLWLKHIAGTELLNDDNPAVRYDAPTKRCYVYGTPWSGKTPCYRNLRAEVGGFLRLHQHPENIIKQLSPLEAFASILSSCSSMLWDKRSYSALCNTISSIVACTSAYDLQCLPDQAAAELSYSTMRRV